MLVYLFLVVANHLSSLATDSRKGVYERNVCAAFSQASDKRQDRILKRISTIQTLDNGSVGKDGIRHEEEAVQ